MYTETTSIYEKEGSKSMLRGIGGDGHELGFWKYPEEQGKKQVIKTLGYRQERFILPWGEGGGVIPPKYTVNI